MVWGDETMLKVHQRIVMINIICFGVFLILFALILLNG